MNRTGITDPLFALKFGNQRSEKGGGRFVPGNQRPLPQFQSLNLHCNSAIMSTLRKAAVSKGVPDISFLPTRTMTHCEPDTVANSRGCEGWVLQSFWRSFTSTPHGILQKQKYGTGQKNYPVKFLPPTEPLRWKANTLHVHGWLLLIVNNLLPFEISEQEGFYEK